MLTREEILKAKDLKTKVVKVPEWNGEVTIQALSLKDFADIERAAKGIDGKLDTLKLAIATFIAGVIEPKFERADIEELQYRNVNSMTDIVTEINKLSGKMIDQKNDLKATGVEGTK